MISYKAHSFNSIREYKFLSINGLEKWDKSIKNINFNNYLMTVKKLIWDDHRPKTLNYNYNISRVKHRQTFQRNLE